MVGMWHFGWKGFLRRYIEKNQNQKQKTLLIPGGEIVSFEKGKVGGMGDHC